MKRSQRVATARVGGANGEYDDDDDGVCISEYGCRVCNWYLARARGDDDSRKVV